MAKQAAVSVREALGGRQRPRRSRASEDPWATQAARKDFRALGWALEYTQHHQLLLWLGLGLAGFAGARTGSEPQPWGLYEGWHDW